MIVFTRGSTGLVHDKTTSLFPCAAASVGAFGFLPIEIVSVNDIDSESFGGYLSSASSVSDNDSDKLITGVLVILSANEIVSVND